MANFNKIIFTISVLILLFISSCSGEIDYSFIEKNGDRIITEFSDVSISKRENIYVIEDNMTNPSSFFEFKKDGDQYLLVKGSSLDKETVNRFLGKINYLESIGFNASSVKDKNYGIDIKLYGTDQNLIYCQDDNLVQEKRWKEYLISLRKIQDHWYVEKL